jgi:hypothetical protein
MYINNSLPTRLGIYDVPVKEFFSYQYLPVKMSGNHIIKIEPRLNILSSLLGAISCDFVAYKGLNKFIDSYMYLTAKNRIVSPDCHFNRDGYHIDGYGTEDTNYIWSNSSPTEFNFGEFNLSDDDSISLAEMAAQAKSENICVYKNNSLLRLDSTVVHRVAKPTSVSPRCFVKVSFSESKYNLDGNSHNYEFDYSWEMLERKIDRNQPNVRPDKILQK